MIYNVAVAKDNGDTLEMILAEPELSGFAIIRIDGLGPEDADISSTDITYGDGSIINNTRVKSKPIQFDIVYLWNSTIEESRNILYDYFKISENVRLYFQTETKYVYIDGVVQSHKPDIFNEQSGVSIIVECPDPYFKEVTDFTIPFYGVDSGFIFPFCNDSLEEKLLTFGEIIISDNVRVLYSGNKDTGFTIDGKVNGSFNTFEIGCNEDVMIFNNINAVSGDRIIINTRAGQKQAVLIRGNNTINLVSKLDIANSNWLYLQPGTNTIYYNKNSSKFSELTAKANILYRGI